MAELELVGFDALGTELEAPQDPADFYVAKRKVHLYFDLSTDALIDGRTVGADGAKLDFVVITGPVDLDAMQLQMDGLTSAVVLRGTWDPTSGSFPTSTSAGDTWISTNIATVDGVDFKVDDRITALVDGASASIYTGQWLRSTYSDLVTSVAGRVGAITLLEADITDLQAYLLAADIASLAGLNALILDATLVDVGDVATAAQGVLASNSVQEGDPRLDDILVSYLVANLPVGVVGHRLQVSDGDPALSWGDTVINSGAGTTPYMVWYNGNNWTVVGK
jgi:hypothetical protein